LDTSAALDRARSFYQIGSYDQCAEAYAQLLPDDQPPTPRAAALEQARTTYAACLLALGKREAADRQLRAAMKQNPLMASPDPIVFPAQVRDLFFQVKSDFLEEVQRAQDEQLREARLQEEAKARRALLERQRVQALERLARQETLIHRNQRWIAALPFGVGQFQNGQNVLGALFLTTEGALLAATIGGAAWQLRIHSDAKGGRDVQDPDAINGTLTLAHNVELWAGAGFFLLAGIGILEAQLNFSEEVSLGTRERVLAPPRVAPKRPLSPTTPVPSVAPVQGGAVLGLTGHF
jgi:hypothetical protein